MANENDPQGTGNNDPAPTPTTPVSSPEPVVGASIGSAPAPEPVPASATVPADAPASNPATGEPPKLETTEPAAVTGVPVSDKITVNLSGAESKNFEVASGTKIGDAFKSAGLTFSDFTVRDVATDKTMLAATAMNADKKFAVTKKARGG